MPAYGGWGAPGGIVAAANVGVALVAVSAFSPYQYAPYDYYYGTVPAYGYLPAYVPVYGSGCGC